MARAKPYKVRVKRSIECWVDVMADSPQDAESRVRAMPSVTHVFPGTAAFCGDNARPEPLLTIEESEE